MDTVRILAAHSFDSRLIKGDANNMISVDLADNNPRGIQISSWGKTGLNERHVAYTFKTEHYPVPSNGDCSTLSNTNANKDKPVKITDSFGSYCSASNDNKTYTELGNAVKLDDGYLISFASEQGLSNSLIAPGKVLNMARDIGVVKVPLDFANIASDNNNRNVVLDSISILSGDEELGSFYNYWVTKQEQRNVGVKWLTKFGDDTPVINNAPEYNTSRLHSALVNDKVLHIYENWSSAQYIKTSYIITDTDGVTLSSGDFNYDVRLPKSDQYYVDADGNLNFAVSVVENNKSEIVNYTIAVK